MNFFKNFSSFFESKNSKNQDIQNHNSSSHEKKSILAQNNYTNMVLSNLSNWEDESDFSSYSLGGAHVSYAKNPIVFRAVNLIISAASSIKLNVMQHNILENKNYLLNSNHQLSRLVESPNFTIHCSEFIEKIIYNLLLFGNVFLLKINYQDLPKEIHILNSNKVSILTNQESGEVYGFKYQGESNLSKEYLIDFQTGECDILHLKNAQGAENLYGLSSLEPIFSHIKYHNNMIKWNQSLLRNGARPSGAFFLKEDKNGNFQYLTDVQMNALQNQITKYCSMSQAGKPMVIQGPLDWKEFSVKPRDMDFLNSDKITIKHIANALGVPVQLLGESDSSSYNNFLEAKKMLYELTVIPLLNKIICNVFNHWICTEFNKKNQKTRMRYFVNFDENEIPVLSYKKEEKLRALKESNFLTINEKRREMGFDPIVNGDRIE